MVRPRPANNGLYLIDCLNDHGLLHINTMPIIATSMLFLVITLITGLCHCFSVSKINRIKSAITDQLPIKGDAISIPLDMSDCNSISFSSDFVSQQITLDTYSSFARDRHEACTNLFDGYQTSLVRCELLDETTLNVRWNATWIPDGSSWLYQLANLIQWDITTKSPDPAVTVVFSWKSVFNVFQKAFATGGIVLPVSLVEGSTIVKFSDTSTTVKIEESIDLVTEADKNRLQNRRVAQELASWLDVRRPPDTDSINVDEWAGMVRQRILSGVPGAGALDIDPNEDGEAGVALAIFGVISLAVLALSFQYFVVPEIVGGVGTVPSKCDDAAILEFGSGYLSECFGPFGDPVYTK